jgi:hypothetical protein
VNSTSGHDDSFKLGVLMKSLFAIAALSLGLSLTACVETTHQTCTDDRLEDVPGIEGTHSFSILSDKFELQTQKISIRRVDKGQYAMNEAVGDLARSCKVGSNYVLESKTKYGTYQMLAVAPSSKGLSISNFVIGVQELAAAHVQFQIVERVIEESTQKRLAAVGLSRLEQSKSRVLVIDNSTEEARKEIEASSRPFGVGYILE